MAGMRILEEKLQWLELLINDVQLILLSRCNVRKALFSNVRMPIVT
jgi:hypothetical protein